jgi:predicted Zn-dependent protease
MDLNNPAKAIREMQAVVAENPLDKATAHYDLARAYLAGNQPDEAEFHLIDALEAAPGYRPAQKMLLELTSGKENR